MKRTFRSFTYKTTECRICSATYDLITAALIKQRTLLENYIAGHPDFFASISPLPCTHNAPEIVKRMTNAASLAKTGPMAAVAGALAQMGAEAAGCGDVIIENGGDIFMQITARAQIKISASSTGKAGGLAFSVRPDETPLAICSSSGIMGHSFSKGRCELATVCSSDAALADAAATQAANMVNSAEDIQPALEHIISISGIGGILISHAGKIGMAGKLPQLVKG